MSENTKTLSLSLIELQFFYEKLVLEDKHNIDGPVRRNFSNKTFCTIRRIQKVYEAAAKPFEDLKREIIGGFMADSETVLAEKLENIETEEAQNLVRQEHFAEREQGVRKLLMEHPRLSYLNFTQKHDLVCTRTTYEDVARILEDCNFVTEDTLLGEVLDFFAVGFDDAQDVVTSTKAPEIPGTDKLDTTPHEDDKLTQLEVEEASKEV